MKKRNGASDSSLMSQIKRKKADNKSQMSLFDALVECAIFGESSGKHSDDDTGTRKNRKHNCIG